MKIAMQSSLQTHFLNHYFCSFFAIEKVVKFKVYFLRFFRDKNRFEIYSEITKESTAALTLFNYTTPCLSRSTARCGELSINISPVSLNNGETLWDWRMRTCGLLIQDKTRKNDNKLRSNFPINNNTRWNVQTSFP